MTATDGWATFAHTVLVDMRARLAASKDPRRLFEVTLQAASKAGLVRQQGHLLQTLRVSTDTTHYEYRLSVRSGDYRLELSDLPHELVVSAMGGQIVRADSAWSGELPRRHCPQS